MTSIRRTGLLLAATALMAASAFAGDLATLKERHGKALAAVQSDETAADRVRAIAALTSLDDADAAKAIVECVAQLAARQTAMEAAHAQTLKEYKPFSGFTMKQKADWDTKRLLLAKLMIEEDGLRAHTEVAHGVTVAIARMRNSAALEVLDRAAGAEADARARTVHVSALILNTASNVAAVVKRAWKDPSPAVRLGALESLAVRKDPALLELTAAGLKEPGWPLRQAAIHALEALADVRGVPYLIAAMQTETGTLLEDYERVLAALTGQALGRFPDAWASWYDANREALAARGAKPVASSKAAKSSGSGFSYYGVETRSKRVLFVLDISGSMKEPIGQTAGEVTGVARSENLTGPKIEVAKRLLLDAVQKLDPETTFNIVFFNHAVETFQEQMVPATPENKAKAELALIDLKPVGCTWAYGALRRVFDFAGVTDAPVTGKFDPKADTVFFLSDGAPTDDSLDAAKPMEPETILSAVRDWNRLAHLKVHTIAIDPRIGAGAMVRFMKGLAAQNGGTYSAVGAQ